MNVAAGRSNSRDDLAGSGTPRGACFEKISKREEVEGSMRSEARRECSRMRWAWFGGWLIAAGMLLPLSSALAAPVMVVGSFQ